jgi:nitroimidazol reductase NimA-like FMN-containing flavoprotein (pyridoxamine 5'-phosphate oxidase superfamily)
MPTASPASADPRATIRMHPERGVSDEVSDILADGIVVHVAFVDDGQPFAIPMTYQHDPAAPERLHLHGAHHGRLMKHLQSGAVVCVSLTLVDGLVYSRTALNHSVNYRSVVGFGRAAARQPELAERRRILDAMIGRYFPGRTPGVDYEITPDVHLDATAFVTLEIEAWSAKARRGGAKGPRDADPDAPGTAGVVALGRGR